MKAIVVKQYGAPDVLQVETVPIPQPKENEVLIKVMSAGVNPVETYRRAGTNGPPLPWIPGSDGAGVIEQVGSGVSSYKTGDRVWIKGGSGTYAQYCVAPESSVSPLPPNTTFEQGASLWVPYGTAYHALFQAAHTQKDSKLFIHGASGGVGQACLQFAKIIPGKPVVIGTASTPEGLKLIEAEGAIALNHKEQGYTEKVLAATNGEGANVILEMLANVNLGKDLPLLARGGTVVVIGNRGTVEINARDLMQRRASVQGVALNLATPDEVNEIVSAINKYLGEGILNPHIGKIYKLSEAPQSHHDIINPPLGATGKIVINPWEL